MPNDAAAADFNDLKKKERIKSISDEVSAKIINLI